MKTQHSVQMLTAVLLLLSVTFATCATVAKPLMMQKGELVPITNKKHQSAHTGAGAHAGAALAQVVSEDSGAHAGGSVGAGIAGNAAAYTSAVEALAADADAVLQNMIGALIRGDGPPMQDITRAAVSKMDVSEAVVRLKSKLPVELATLVNDVTHADKKGPFEEESLNKALKILNGMVEKSFTELDTELVKCKEFQERNRMTQDQVEADLTRLGEQVADLERQRGMAIQGINDNDLEMDKVGWKLRVATWYYNKDLSADRTEMTLRKNDLAVMQFILELTKCADAPGAAAFPQLVKQPEMQICDTDAGLVFHFDDPETQARLESMMTPESRQAMAEILGQMPGIPRSESSVWGAAATKGGFMQRRGSVSKVNQANVHALDAWYAEADAEEGISDDDDTMNLEEEQEVDPLDEMLKAVGNKTEADSMGATAKLFERQLERSTKRKEARVLARATQASLVGAAMALNRREPAAAAPAAKVKVEMPPKAPVQDREPVAKRPSTGGGQWKKCANSKPDCGLLHDTMAIQWGKFKDLVDELQHEIDTEKASFDELKASYNAEILALRMSKAKFSLLLAEATSNMNADHSETTAKERQQWELSKEYDSFMGKCRSTITEIMFTNICAVKKVRGEVMVFSKVHPPEKIEDCDVSDWVPGDCSVPCDDKCPDPKDPLACGGVLTITREVLVKANEYGIKCPAVSMQKKCNQFKCPVDCALSKWSGFSACTKDCESGVQGRTRSIITKPKNGGSGCNTVQETRPCNTGSCDRDCKLAEWTPFSPCSMACSGGTQEKARKVQIPTRGNGLCPKDDSSLRHVLQACNDHECAGDETCIAVQDLIIAIDGSGSVRAEGFAILRDFAAKTIQRYKSQYYGHEAMKIGVIQFGNGKVDKDGVVSAAVNVQPMTDDLGAVQKSIEGLQWQKGFTNMAQAFTLADTMLTAGGRQHAQSAILVITDGKPSFMFKTSQKIQALKDKGNKLFFATISRFPGKDLNIFKQWASQPWETNMLHIPGLEPLQADMDVFAQKVVEKFCPNALSISTSSEMEDFQRYFLLKENGRCGDIGKLLSEKVVSVEECANLAREALGDGIGAFSVGTRNRLGHCHAGTLPVDVAQIAAWKGERANPSCPSGKWDDEPFFDMFILEPVFE